MNQTKVIETLQNIVYKYTGINIPTYINQLVDHTAHINNNSAFVLYEPKTLNVNIYIENIFNSLQVINKLDELVIFFINGSEKYFENKNLPGLHIKVTDKIIDSIINEYYCKRPKYIVGVTGTCGKTSTTTFLYHLGESLGIKSVLLNTLGLQGLNKNLMPHNLNTTYSNLTSKRIIHNSALENVELLIIEVSSHGIKQNRIKDIVFDGGIWTNFDVDHLEFHGTLEDYFNTKKEFISSLPIQIVNENVYEFFNLDVNFGEKYGQKTNNINDNGFIYNNKNYKGNFTVKFYQQVNLLGAMILLYRLGYENVFEKININIQLPSRMEFFGYTVNGAEVYSDDAYRPDNINKIINYFSIYNLKRVILIIGAGGSRNRGIDYRSNIGKLSDKFYKMIITDDNPRNEDPNTIRSDIMQNNLNIWNIPYRADALQVAFNFARKENIILILAHGSDETVLYKNYYGIMSDKEIFKYHLLVNEKS